MLSEKIASLELADAVLLCLTDQKKYLFAQPLKVCSKIWFQVGNQRILGRGLAKLLENIERTGTLQQAAIDSGMSYRYAWKLIQTAQDRLGKILVNKHPGGKSGGASEPTPKKNFSISSSRNLRAAGSIGVSRFSLISIV